MADAQRCDGYRLTLRCDTCGISEQSHLLGRHRDAGRPPDGALRALIEGWGFQHEGHEQIVLASPVSVEFLSVEDDEGPAEVLLRDLVYEAVRTRMSAETIDVLLAFAYVTDVDGVAEVSVRELARRMDRSSGTVSRHVNRLVEHRFLEDLGRSPADGRRRRWLVAGMERRDEATGSS
jgi:DNA-binding MarR family transcriptional regulator